MSPGATLIASIVQHNKYAKHLPEHNRRETRRETQDRTKRMHQGKYPHLAAEIDAVYERSVYTDRISGGSMRSLQFGGDRILKHNAAINNCAALPVDHPRAFAEALYLLLCGCGVGFSVERHNIDKLPPLTSPRADRPKSYVVEDSIIGWAEALDTLVYTYTMNSTHKVEFDYRDITPRGVRLSSGIIAPGPDQLAESLEGIRAILDSVPHGQRLRPIQCHDIMCIASDCVASGGVRRSAMISMFDWNDEEMLTSKVGNWYETHPYRARANNSARINKTKPDAKERFDHVASYARAALLTGSGDPGFGMVNDDDYIPNPCFEAWLRNNFCNLITVNGAMVTTQRELNDAVKDAAFIATLQTGYTDYRFLRPIWKERTEAEALIGVGITSWVEGEALDLDLELAAELVKAQNAITADLIGVNPAHRCTVSKPDGTSTLYFGNNASGIHDAPVRYNPETTENGDMFYVRRMRFGKTEPLYLWLRDNMPALLEDCAMKPDTTAVLSIPVKVEHPDDFKWARGPIELLERAFVVNDTWIKGGHRKGPNGSTNNVSLTVQVKPEEHDEVFAYLWDQRDRYMGVSVLPDWGTANYPQMPLEPCDAATYNAMLANLVSFESESIFEPEDITEFLSTGAACVGGACAL